jgi:hypothetical protein
VWIGTLYFDNGHATEAVTSSASICPPLSSMVL